MIEVIEYVDARGVSSYAKWIATLDPTVQARITRCVLRLAAGHIAAVKGLGLGLQELKIDFGPGYRVYFGRVGTRLVVLLGGGSKQRQQKDIEAAQELWQEFKHKQRSK